MAAASSGDRTRSSPAIAALFSRHRPRLRALALRLTRSEAEADDVVQDTFVAVLEKIAGFRGESLFGSWVYRVAANVALMRLRSPSARRRVAMRPEDFVELPADRAPLDELCDARLRLKALGRASARLPASAREVIELRVVAGLDTTEVARRLGISEDAAKVRLHRARAALARLAA